MASKETCCFFTRLITGLRLIIPMNVYYEQNINKFSEMENKYY